MLPPLTIQLFGGVHLFYNDAPLPIPKSRKGLALFLYLACTQRAHTREALADLLWDTTSIKQSLSNLRTVLSRLPAALRDLIVLTGESVAIKPGALQVDVWALEQTVDRLAQPLSAPVAAQARRSLQNYRGDFLAGFQLNDAPRFEEWMLIERERLRMRALAGYQRLTDYCLETGAYREQDSRLPPNCCAWTPPMKPATAT
ncbi:MAG: BTAD domain-containing putative transcriptional regulator [Caldilineaceae bacterium]